MLIRGAGNGFRMRSDWTRDKFLKQWGKRVMNVAKIPYGGAFGVPGSTQTLEQYLEVVDLHSQSEAVPEQTPAYAFEGKFLTEEPSMGQYFEAKQVMRELGARSTVSDFFLGMAGTGAQWHINDIAVNVLAHGRKR